MEQSQIGELLLRENLITREQLDKALAEQQQGGTRIGFTLVSNGALSETELTRLLSRQYRVPAVDLSEVEVDSKILSWFPPISLPSTSCSPFVAWAAPSPSPW